VPRAMLLFERQSDASWLPTTVILATPKRLQGKCLPGSPDRDARLARILTDALPPRINDQTEERGTFEDWISWGVYNLANGMTTWATEIKPEAPWTRCTSARLRTQSPRCHPRPRLSNQTPLAKRAASNSSRSPKA
jgi:hypothetical protein